MTYCAGIVPVVSVGQHVSVGANQAVGDLTLLSAQSVVVCIL